MRKTRIVAKDYYFPSTSITSVVYVGTCCFVYENCCMLLENSTPRFTYAKGFATIKVVNIFIV